MVLNALRGRRRYRTTFCITSSCFVLFCIHCLVLSFFSNLSLALMLASDPSLSPPKQSPYKTLTQGAPTQSFLLSEESGSARE
jgi:hypothetical protein